MTHDEERSVKGQVLLELRETSQALSVRNEKYKAWVKALENLARRLGETASVLSPEDEKLFDLPAFRALVAEMEDLSAKKSALDERARALGL